MKLHPDDPRLTAYLLGELSAAEAAEVARAAAADPALGMALRELQGVQSLLANTLAPTSGSLLPHQRTTVLRAARQQDLVSKVIPLASQRKSWKTYLVPVAAAALVTLATVIVINLPFNSGSDTASNRKPGPADWDRDMPLEIALLPAPGPADESGRAADQATGTASNRLTEQAAARDRALATTGDEFLRKVSDRLRQTPVPPPASLPPARPRDSVTVASHPVLPLPIHAGRASLGWITHAVRTDHQRPATAAVRLEEILNQFNLRPVGGAAISDGVTLATESVACPWKPSATLLLIAVRGAPTSAHDIKAAFHADATAAARYRLLGFAPVSGLKAGPLPARLPAKAFTTIAIEIEPATATGQLGTIEWSVDGQPAAAVPVTRHLATEPSDDARFGALVCAFAQWLAHDQTALIDADLVAALTRECSAASLDADRRDFILLIEQTLGLAP